MWVGSYVIYDIVSVAIADAGMYSNCSEHNKP